MGRKNYKRRNYFIKKNFQGKLILGYFIVMLVGCLIFALALSWMSSESMTVIYSNNDLQIGKTPLMLMKQLVLANWFVIVIGGALVVFVATHITHRLAGPMFNLERSLDKMIDGRLDTVIYLRKKDEGKELAAKINQFNAELSASVMQISKRSQDIEVLLSICSALPAGPTKEKEVQSIHASILKQTQAIGEIVGRYTLPNE
jgi:methyl-accepting chemotaxis protein